MSKNVMHYEKIIRGSKNRGKNFALGEEIFLDDEGFIRQSGVDDKGIEEYDKTHKMLKIHKRPILKREN